MGENAALTAVQEVVDRIDVADFPLAAKLTTWGVDLHMGLLFGLANQLVLFVLAFGIASMVVLGYTMWWKRRPTREPRGLPGPAPVRGAMRGAPWWGLVTVVTAALVVGWFLPLVGYTLATFVVVDVLIGVARKRRDRDRVPSCPGVTARNHISSARQGDPRMRRRAG